MLGFLISHTVKPNDRPDVTFQVGGTVRVGQSGPRVCALVPGVLFPQQGPLDHHEDRRGAFVDQSPGERHTGAVDDRHAEVMHAAACQRPNTWLSLLVLQFLEEASWLYNNQMEVRPEGQPNHCALQLMAAAPPSEQNWNLHRDVSMHILPS